MGSMGPDHFFVILQRPDSSHHLMWFRVDAGTIMELGSMALAAGGGFGGSPLGVSSLGGVACPPPSATPSAPTGVGALNPGGGGFNNPWGGFNAGGAAADNTTEQWGTEDTNPPNPPAPFGGFGGFGAFGGGYDSEGKS